MAINRKEGHACGGSKKLEREIKREKELYFLRTSDPRLARGMK